MRPRLHYAYIKPGSGADLVFRITGAFVSSCVYAAVTTVAIAMALGLAWIVVLNLAAFIWPDRFAATFTATAYGWAAVSYLLGAAALVVLGTLSVRVEYAEWRELRELREGTAATNTDTER